MTLSSIIPASILATPHIPGSIKIAGNGNEGLEKAEVEMQEMEKCLSFSIPAILSVVFMSSISASYPRGTPGIDAFYCFFLNIQRVLY